MLAVVEHDDAAGGAASHAATGVGERDTMGEAEFEERLARLNGQRGGWARRLYRSITLFSVREFSEPLSSAVRRIIDGRCLPATRVCAVGPDPMPKNRDAP